MTGLTMTYGVTGMTMMAEQNVNTQLTPRRAMRKLCAHCMNGLVYCRLTTHACNILFVPSHNCWPNPLLLLLLLNHSPYTDIFDGSTKQGPVLTLVPEVGSPAQVVIENIYAGKVRHGVGQTDSRST